MMRIASLVLLDDGTPCPDASLDWLATCAQALDRPLTVLSLGGGAPDLPHRLAERTGTTPRTLPATEQTLAAALDVCAADGTPAIVLRSGLRSGLRRLLAHNRHERLLHQFHLPVLALPDATPPLRRILFPLDLVPRSEPLLREAAALARDLSAELHLLHVFGADLPLPAERDMARRQAARSPLELFNIDRTRLRELADLARDAGARVVSATAEGRAHREIVRYAAEHQAGLVVMASHGIRSLEDRMYGTTTERVMQAASVPVLGIHSEPVAVAVGA